MDILVFVYSIILFILEKIKGKIIFFQKTIDMLILVIRKKCIWFIKRNKRFKVLEIRFYFTQKEWLNKNKLFGTKGT